MGNRTKIMVMEVVPEGITNDGWRRFKVKIDLHRYSSPTIIRDPHLHLAIPPESVRKPIVGDQLLIAQLKHYAWGVNVWTIVDSFFNGLDDYQYISSEKGKQTYPMTNGEMELYRMPDHDVSFLEIKLVKSYYNPVTEKRQCDVVTSSTLELDDSVVDSFLWAIYERKEGTKRAECLGDWCSQHKAWTVFDYLSNVIKIRRKFTQHGNTD